MTQRIYNIKKYKDFITSEYHDYSLSIESLNQEKVDELAKTASFQAMVNDVITPIYNKIKNNTELSKKEEEQLKKYEDLKASALNDGKMNLSEFYQTMKDDANKTNQFFYQNNLTNTTLPFSYNYYKQLQSKVKQSSFYKKLSDCMTNNEQTLIYILSLQALDSKYDKEFKEKNILNKKEMLSYILSYYISNKVSVQYTSAIDLVSLLREYHMDDSVRSSLNQLYEDDVLIIDNFDTCPIITNVTVPYISSIIDYRCQNNKLTFIFSNIAAKETTFAQAYSPFIPLKNNTSITQETFVLF